VQTQVSHVLTQAPTHQETLARIHAYAKEIRSKLRGCVVYGVAVNDHDDPDVELVAAYCMALLDGGISSEVHIGGHRTAQTSDNSS